MCLELIRELISSVSEQSCMFREHWNFSGLLIYVRKKKYYIRKKKYCLDPIQELVTTAYEVFLMFTALEDFQLQSCSFFGPKAAILEEIMENARRSSGPLLG